MARKKEDKIYTVLTQIEENLQRQNSPRRVFVLGLFRGFGTALGATVLLAVATSIIIQLSSTFDLNTFLTYFFGSAVQ